MTIWFIFGHEPWLLPPALEMVEALEDAGHRLYIFYIGDIPKEGDFQFEEFLRLPRQVGIKRLLMPFRLASIISQATSRGVPDFILACDVLALEALSYVTLPPAVRTGYWAFEVNEIPRRFRLSADYYRALMFSRWISRLTLILAPSESRLAQLRRRCRKIGKSLIIFNSKRNGRRMMMPVAAVVDHAMNSCDIKLVSSGRIDYGHGLMELVEALRLLPKNIGLFLAGGGNEEFRRRLQRRAEEIQVASRFLLLPRLTRAENDFLLSRADIGVVIYEEAGCIARFDVAPNKLGDYVGGGLAIIGTDQPYLRHWVDTGVYMRCRRVPTVRGPIGEGEGSGEGPVSIPTEYGCADEEVRRVDGRIEE